jgi:superfamily II DNA or RNA helicase
MPLFKARLIIPITQRLAKSTLAPVATPAQQVRVGDTLAYWRENGTGLGVLQIPLASGKSLLVLAADLALALRDGADELARVLSGLAPARALIAKVGQLKTARKVA